MDSSYGLSSFILMSLLASKVLLLSSASARNSSREFCYKMDLNFLALSISALSSLGWVKIALGSLNTSFFLRLLMMDLPNPDFWCFFINKE